MANMGYCRFCNTRLDVEDCLDALRDEKLMSSDEANAGRWMFEGILEFCRDNGIIDSFDSEMIQAIFHGLTKREDGEDE